MPIAYDIYARSKIFLNFYYRFLCITLTNKKFILARCCCLGNSLFERTLPKNSDRLRILNLQEIRVDVFPPDKIINHQTIRKFNGNYYIFNLLQQLCFFSWGRVTDIDFLLMDSFSELTTKKFINKKDKWFFVAHNSSVNQDADFKENFDNGGMMEIDRFEYEYRKFFDWFESKYPNKPVYFFHFPTTLDSRQIYKIRAQKIRDVVDALAAEKKYLHSISVEDSFVDWSESDFEHKEPYHFFSKTYEEFVNKLNNIINLPQK